MMINSIFALTKFFFLDNNFLYIDPNLRSALIGVIIAGLAGAGMTLKLYWVKIKLKFFDKN